MSMGHGKMVKTTETEVGLVGDLFIYLFISVVERLGRCN
jgi:hypothetical protein